MHFLNKNLMVLDVLWVVYLFDVFQSGTMTFIRISLMVQIYYQSSLQP